MATYTLLQLRTFAKQESDNVGQSFISDAEWNGYIQRAYNEMYGLVAQVYGDDYYAPAAPYQFTTDGTNRFFSLAGVTGGFFKLRGVDVQVSSPGQWISLKPFEFSDRNRISVYNNPIPMAGQVIQVWYTPLPTLPSADGDSIDGVNGWEEYVIADACIRALRKEEADLSAWFKAKADFKERLEAEAENRNSGAAHKISDTLGRASRSMMYRLEGSNLWLIGNSGPGWWPAGDWPADPFSGLY
jgi:hypothetical protein